MENVITFDTGVREFNILGVVTVSFCPTDINFAESIFQALEDIGDYYTDYQTRAAKIAEMLYNGGGTVLSDEKSDMGAGAERPARTDRTADDDARTWENADGCGAFFFRIRISWPDSEGRETD